MIGGFPMLRQRRRSRLTTNALLLLLGGTITLGLMFLAARQARQRHTGGPPPDYSHRSGWPEPAEQMRGRARGSFDIPRDMRPPQAWG